MLHGLILTTKQQTFVAKEAAARFAGPTAAQAQAAVTVQNCYRAYMITQLYASNCKGTAPVQDTIYHGQP